MKHHCTDGKELNLLPYLSCAGKKGDIKTTTDCENLMHLDMMSGLCLS